MSCQLCVLIFVFSVLCCVFLPCSLQEGVVWSFALLCSLGYCIRDICDIEFARTRVKVGK